MRLFVCFFFVARCWFEKFLLRNKFEILFCLIAFHFCRFCIIFVKVFSAQGNFRKCLEFFEIFPDCYARGFLGMCSRFSKAKVVVRVILVFLGMFRGLQRIVVPKGKRQNFLRGCGFCTEKVQKVLGIESSCDDTGVAIIDTNGNLIAESVASQLAFHNRMGGVNPPVAQRVKFFASLISDFFIYFGFSCIKKTCCPRRRPCLMRQD